MKTFSNHILYTEPDNRGGHGLGHGVDQVGHDHLHHHQMQQQHILVAIMTNYQIINKPILSYLRFISLLCLENVIYFTYVGKVITPVPWRARTRSCTALSQTGNRTGFHYSVVSVYIIWGIFYDQI